MDRKYEAPPIIFTDDGWILSGMGRAAEFRGRGVASILFSRGRLMAILRELPCDARHMER